MPFIEESDLLELHKDVDKAQIINERLLDQIKFKNKEIRRSKIQRNIFGVLTAVFLIGTLVIASYIAGAGNRQLNDQQLITSTSLDSLDAIRHKVANLKQQNQELSLVNEYYLAKKFLLQEKVYSVQVKSFVENNIALASEGLTNTMFVKTNPYFSYSLGNFETLEEAQKFRSQLVSMGFEDSFVASYKGGKRLKIEDPN